ncbi:MAG: hypothetical protein ACK56I_10365, partial [bacterium]
GENVFEIPCNLIISSFDPWEDKKEIIELVKGAENEERMSALDSGWITKAVMTIRYMIEARKERPFDYGHGDDVQKF